MVQNQNQQPPQDTGKLINQIKELIAKNTTGIIALPAKATPDAIAAGTSMYLALTKMGKTVSLVSSETPQSDLVGIDKIQNNLSTGGNNLVVSFPYKDGAIDKVDYNIVDERFNLIIAPREGFAKLEPKEVQFSYTGGKIEFIITIDTPNLNALGEIYQKNENSFNGKNIVNIDRHLINNNYGTINLVVKTSSSTSELVYKVIKGLGTQIDKDIATNIYAGIVGATNNFGSYSVNADTFETVAGLLRAGAVRKPVTAQFGRPGMPGQGMPGMRPMNPMNMNPQSAMMPPMPQGFSPFNQAGMPQGMPQQMPQPMPMMPQPQPVRMPMPQAPQRDEQQATSIEDVETEIDDKEGSITEGQNPENWLKPKIFSGKGGLV